jgi:hypothetical protein
VGENVWKGNVEVESLGSRWLALLWSDVLGV